MKETELVPGKWYKNKENWSYHLYVKLNSFDGHYMNYSEKINPIFEYKAGKGQCVPHISTLKEATLEEIQQYLPEGHSDKIKPMKTLPEEYVVECKNAREITIVGKALYPKDSIWSGMGFWEYIFFAKSSKSSREGYCSSRGFNRNIYSDLNHLPIFTYNEWKELFYKQEKMKEEFVLPEKWYIKTTAESNNTIVDWYCKVNNRGNANGLDTSIGNYITSDKRGLMYWAGDSVKLYTEITFEQFKKYVLKEETMKAQLFSITGSPALLKAMWEELTGLGYYQKNKSYTPLEKIDIKSITTNQCRIDNIALNDFKEIVAITRVETGVLYKQFSLPSQYNEALAFAKAQLAPALWEEPEVKLPFANLTFTVNKSKGTATCEHGTITKADIKAVIDAIVSPKARLLGYDLETKVTALTSIRFGCQTGTLSQAQAILKALE